MSDFKELKGEGDVISMQGSFPNNFISQPMFKMGDVVRAIQARFLGINLNDWDNERYNEPKKWIDEGLEAEILRVGSNGWKKGKVRIKVSVEFCPDEPEKSEPESPLDDVRKTMN